MDYTPNVLATSKYTLKSSVYMLNQFFCGENQTEN